MTDELRELCAAAVEGRLSPEQAARLEAIVLADPEARRFYADFVAVHAALAWAAADPKVLGQPPAPARRPAPRRFGRRAGWAVAAALLVGVVALATRGPGRAAVATLVSVGDCKWNGGTLPTEEGARLVPGRLRLAEGVARIRFDTGAEVRVEGPAELEVIDRGRCVLHAGRLVAKVPPEAIGFKVDTPAAELTDFGTEFGVTVRDGQTSDVQVFEGVVDGRPRDQDAVRRMTTGQNLRFTPKAVAEFDPQAESPPAPPAPPAGTEVLTLTTAMGRGKDAYVYAVPNPIHHSDVLLLVKNSVPAPGDKRPNPTPYDRKVYVGIDLRPLGRRDLLDAQLTFTLAPTGMGFASEVPDATFAVYGLTDEALDGWDEKTVTWATAPANRPGGVALDPSKVTLLGRFGVPQGVYSGTRSVGGPDLVRFLAADTNKTATFVLVRETLGSGRHDLVHGFANKRHPTLPPPTLRLTVAGR